MMASNFTVTQCDSDSESLCKTTGYLEKIPMSLWLLALLHICGVIPMPISAETPCRCCHAVGRFHRAERRYCHIEWPGMGSVRVFHDVSQSFKSVLLFYQWFTMFYVCFTMYHNVLPVFYVLCFMVFSESCNNRHWRLRGHRSLQGSAITPRKWSHAKLHPEWRLE